MSGRGKYTFIKLHCFEPKQTKFTLPKANLSKSHHLRPQITENYLVLRDFLLSGEDK